MLKNGFLLVLLCCVSALYGQEITTPYKNRKVTAVNDTVIIDSVSINKVFFKLQDALGNEKNYHTASCSRSLILLPKRR